MPLKVRLNANEKIVVNGAVIQNGDRRTTLTIANQANVLRGKDVMVEGQVDTAVKKLYFLIQKCLIEGEGENGDLKEQTFNLAAELYGVFGRSDMRDNIFVSMNQFSAGDFYKSLAALRPVLEYEAKLIQGHGETQKEEHDVDADESSDRMEFVR